MIWRLFMFKKLLPLLFLFAGLQVNAAVIYEQGAGTETTGGLSGSNAFSKGFHIYQDFSVGQDVTLGAIKFNAYNKANTVPITGMHAQVFSNSAGTVGDLLYDFSYSGNKTGTKTGVAMGFDLVDYTFDVTEFDLTVGDYWLALNVTPNQSNMHWTMIASGQNNYGSYRNTGGGNTGLSGMSGENTFSLLSAPVPEPSIIALFALGLVGIGFARRRQS
jgi:hypothetical protein